MNRLFLKLAMTAMAGKRISLSRRTGVCLNSPRAAGRQSG
jgi:hypothetical protein